MLEEKIPLGRPRRRWGDEIRMDLKDIGWGVEWREIGWGCRVYPVGSGSGPVAASCKYGDESAGSGATYLVS
jgi:hypothetical protein